MSIAHPLRDSGPWGRVEVGGSVLPGVLTDIAVPPRVWEWAVQQGYGQTKVTIYKATGLLEAISFTHFLKLDTRADDWDLLTSTFLPTLIPGWPNAYTGKPRSFPVVHPAIQFLGGKRVHLAKLFAPVPPPGEKIPQFYTLEFQEDVPQKRIPVGPAEPAKINGPPAPKDAFEATLLNALAAFKST
jgi:hypothetical protein